LFFCIIRGCSIGAGKIKARGEIIGESVACPIGNIDLKEIKNKMKSINLEFIFPSP
jgi:hypothetical protein